MTSVVSLLRGVNVGGKRLIKMAELVDLYASIGLANPRSHIQSGNVVFGTTGDDLERLARQIAGAIEKRFDIRSEVVLRTEAELRDVIRRNPFAGRPDVPANKLIVHFLAGDPGPGAQDRLRAIQADPEELHLLGRELYVFYPTGSGASKLSQAKVDRALGVAATGRNWNTVVKLLELAAAQSSAR